jgi:hypothetical protein
MHENMDEIISFRTTKSIKQHFEARARETGCHGLSEYFRRLAANSESSGALNTILFIQDLALSCVAFNNVNIEANNLDPDKVKAAMDDYKVSIINAWNEKNGVA